MQLKYNWRVARKKHKVHEAGARVIHNSDNTTKL